MRSFLFTLVVSIALFFSQISVSADSKNQNSSQHQQTPDQTWLIEQIIELQAKSAKLEGVLQQNNLNANDFKVIDEELQSLRVQLVELKEKLTAQAENQTKELASYDRRISDVSSNTNMWGLILTVFGAILTIAAIFLGFTAKSRAISEARDAAHKIIKSESEDLLLKQEERVNEELGKYSHKFDELHSQLEIQGRQLHAQTLLDKAREDINDKSYKAGLLALDNVLQFIASDTDARLKLFGCRSLILKGVVLGQLKQSDRAIQTYDALIEYVGEDKAPALREHVAYAMANKGIMQGQLTLYEQAIQTYEALIAYVGADRTPALREQVAKAMYNKGFKQGQLNLPEQEIQTYEALIAYVGADQTPALREQVANAYNGIGFTLLCESKQLLHKGDLAGANKLLNQAFAKFDLAIKDRASGMIIGNKGYALALLGQHDESERIFAQALRTEFDGGESLYQATIKDFDINPIPQDDAFREIVERQWAHYVKERKGE